MKLPEKCCEMTEAVSHINDGDTVMVDVLITQALERVESSAIKLKTEVRWHDIFRAVENSRWATEVARRAADTPGLTCRDMPVPMPWPEDFGRFGDDGAKASLLYAGSGEEHAQLHNPDYDFLDALVPVVTDLFSGIVDDLLGFR